jgi:hypothetical protein
MTRNILIFLCCALVFLVFSSCQLARENAGAGMEEERLIGIFITTEPLDLFDFEGYINDNLRRFQGGNILINERNAQKYQGRLYAVLVPRVLTNEETGETVLTHEYVFEGVEGILYCAPSMQSADGVTGYVSAVTDPAISNGHANLSFGDDENSLSLEGTLFAIPSNKAIVYYFNPVYQSSGGDVYSVTGSGFTVSTETYSEGSIYSQTLESATTVTENGRAKTERMSVKISISVMFAPERITIVQMNPDNAVVKLTEYKPEKMPKEFTLEANAAYFIVETHKQDNRGNTIISREIYGRDVESIETFFAREDGLCVRQWTRIN